MLYLAGVPVEPVSHAFGALTVTVQTETGKQQTVQISDLTADGGRAEIQAAITTVRTGG
jgi:hypothetical protein